MKNLLFGIATLGLLTGCGGTSVGNPQVAIKTNPLAGPAAASAGAWPFNLASVSEGLFSSFFGIRPAFAAVSSFSKFQMCLSSVVFERIDGSTEQQNGSSNIPLNPGLLVFDPASTLPMTVGSLNLTFGSILKDVKFTVATVPQLCGGANYSVLFNSGTGQPDQLVTQNVSFRFDFSTPMLIDAPTSITVLLGQIVNGMVTLANANNLNNNTIQTVNVGQAQ